MGYTHFWEKPKAFDAHEWRLIRIRARQILTYAQEMMGIALSEEYDVNMPPIIDDMQIRFNGYADEGHETFVLMQGPKAFDFCKTARKPYDAPVVAILMEAARIAPDAFSWSSDGDNEPDYKDQAQVILDAIDPIEEEIP